MFSPQGLVAVTLGLLAIPVLGRPVPHHTQVVPEKRDVRLDIHAHPVNISPQQDSDVSMTSTTTITTFITRTTYVPSVAKTTSTVTATPPSPPSREPSQRLSLHENGQLGYDIGFIQRRGIETIDVANAITRTPKSIITNALRTKSATVNLATTSVQTQPSPASATTFSINQIRNPRLEEKTQGPSAWNRGLQAMAHVYAKFSIPLTPDIERALQNNGPLSWRPNRIPIAPGKQPWKRGNITSSVLAIPPNGFDQEFISPVQIGTPPQTVFLALDTGSADLWTLSTTTPANLLHPLHAIYSPKNSSTAVHVPSQTWGILYGDGSRAQGTIFLDRVSLSSPGSGTGSSSGGSSSSNMLSVPQQAVGAATLISPHFSADPYLSGILGLGFSRGSSVRSSSSSQAQASSQASSPASSPASSQAQTQAQTQADAQAQAQARARATFFDNARPFLREPVFTADLRASRPGRFAFGSVDRTAYTGEIGWAAVSRESPYWLFDLKGSQVGNSSVTNINTTTNTNTNNANTTGTSTSTTTSTSTSNSTAASNNSSNNNNGTTTTTTTTTTTREAITWYTGEEGGGIKGKGKGKGGGGIKTIADTGTSLVMLPSAMVKEYYDRVDGAGYDQGWAGWVIPCRGQLPDWSFFVGGDGDGQGGEEEEERGRRQKRGQERGHGDGEEEERRGSGRKQTDEYYKGTVPGRYINFGPVNGTHCFGGIQSADGFGFAVFGDVLLKAQFVVFDVGNMRIGFAAKRLRT